MSFHAQVDAYIAAAKARLEDGLTLAELGQLFIGLLGLAVAAARDLTLTGAEKKELVLQAIGFLFDALAPAIPLPLWLRPLRAWILPALKVIVLEVADGAVEAILKLVRVGPGPAATAL